MNTNVILRTALLLTMTLYLASCYSDGSFWFEKSNFARTGNFYKTKDRIAIFEKYDANKIDSMFIDVYVPKDISKMKKVPDLIDRVNQYKIEFVLFNHNKLDSLCIKYRIKLYKDDIVQLHNEFQEYGKNCLDLLKKNKSTGFVMTGRSLFSYGKDTTYINSESKEYYYYCYINIDLSNVYYTSKFYQDEFTLDCNDNLKNYEVIALTFNRTVGKEFSYKLISSIITYKNKQIDSINVIRRTEHQPELERYSWYGMR